MRKPFTIKAGKIIAHQDTHNASVVGGLLVLEYGFSHSYKNYESSNSENDLDVGVVRPSQKKIIIKKHSFLTVQFASS